MKRLVSGQWYKDQWDKARVSKLGRAFFWGWGKASDFILWLVHVIIAMLRWLGIRIEMILAVSLYGGAVVAVLVCCFPGSWKDFIGSWQTKLNYVAARQFEPNYRINIEDLRRPPSVPGAWGWFLPDRATMAGRYVKTTIPQAQEVSAANLQAHPDLTVDQAHDLVFFSLDKQLQFCLLLNAGSYVDVVGPTATVVPKVRVHAIDSVPAGAADKTMPPCFAILELDKEKEPLLAPNQLANLHLALISK
jgi:hypothetical protein